jgi:hypothetical protein
MLGHLSAHSAQKDFSAMGLPKNRTAGILGLKPQIKAPRVTPLEGVSTYREAIRVVWESRTVRFRHDERRFVVTYYE